MQRLLRLFVAVMVISTSAQAQCGAGYTQAQLNWDVMDFLNTNNSYATYVTSAMAATQKFMFASQKVTITNDYAANNFGNSTAFTGTGSSNATGASVRFVGNGTITVTFATAVQNLLFSVYDVDVNQRVQISAASAITLSQPSGGSLTLNNNNTTTARADGASGSNASTSNAATLNVSIPGSITTFTITVTNSGTVTSGNASNREDGSFWLSDITACTNVAAYPTNAYTAAKPWDNQPGYSLVAVENWIYYVNPATGKAKRIFTDPSGDNINSLAYDANTGYIYYTYSLTATPATNKKVMRYDYNTGTLSTWISDVTTLGIPVYESGVESGAAAFYNGALYLGVEGYANGGSTSFGRKSLVWRIDINASGVATAATQAYGIAADNGTSSGIEHDWSDIGIKDGVLYDFDGAASAADVYQYNMYTGAVTRITPSSTWTPRQICLDWNSQLYSMDGTIAQYNGTNNIVTATQKTIASTVNPIPAASSWGDGGEAFKPKGDFGDAPASYDPVATSPAQHELLSTLRLGAAITTEWTKNTSTTAAGDADDGMPTPTIVISGSNYLTNVNVFNNTGAAATLCAWVDFNNNGVFETSEGISMTVNSSTATQTVQLFWPNPISTATAGSYTFIRIRVTSAVNGMTTAKPTGWFDDGEVEDYRVQVNAAVLPSTIVHFDARKRDAQQAQLSWQLADEQPGTVCVLLRSTDGNRWSELFRTAPAAMLCARRDYGYTDAHPAGGVNQYRLQVLRPGGALLSQVRELSFGKDDLLVLWPNPARGSVQVTLQPGSAPAVFRLYTASGALVLEQTLSGGGSHRLPLPASLPDATYMAELSCGNERNTRQLVVRR